MDPLAVLDCAKVLPNKFALTLAAAARSRALHRGAPPRSYRPAASASDLALHEIAEGAFTPAELGLFLDGPSGPELFPRAPASEPELCGGTPSRSAAASVCLPGQTVH